MVELIEELLQKLVLEYCEGHITVNNEPNTKFLYSFDLCLWYHALVKPWSFGGCMGLEIDRAIVAGA